jgi:V/A-type H+-transporting ATPase subunit C
VDVANVRVLVRTRLRAATVAEAQRFFVAGGTVPVERFVEWYRLPLAELAGRLGQLPTFRGMDLAALEDPRRFDVLADAIIARVLTHAAMVPVGPEPVVAYILARRAEISMLRTLLIGRLAGVGTEVLRDRLRGVA